MSTSKDFKNAPMGATATHVDGSRAMKIEDCGCGWMTPDRCYYDDREMVLLGFTLDPSAPTTAQEALELAWELAYPVWEGQNVPKGTRYLKTNASGLAEFIAQFDFKILPGVVSIVRTLEPLPDPEPDSPRRACVQIEGSGSQSLAVSGSARVVEMRFTGTNL